MSAGKAPGAYTTTPETAEMLDVPQAILARWTELFPQIAPVIRGGRRYYGQIDREFIAGLRVLLRLRGFTRAGVENLIRERGAPFIRGVGRGEITAI